MKLKELWAGLKGCFQYNDTRINKLRKIVKIQDNDLGENIYDSKTLSEDVNKYHVVHKKFKYRFFLPFLYLGKFILGKYLRKDIPDKPWNKNLMAWDRAFEKTIDDWVSFYIVKAYNFDDAEKKKIKEFMKSYNVYLLRTLKEFVNTVVLDDTAYREFLNIFTFNMANEIVKLYPNGEINHLLYTAKSLFDINYFNFYNSISEKGVNLNVQDQKKSE